ncbi:hypothetical protein [uncultured Croceitalea sp.]|uniref:hypothetical protein n=1 Tax=uncultured Croceitalea sp. TaxID=1798908 RepID=UPI0033062065
MDDQKKLESIIDTLMEHDELTAPSADFTKKIMLSIAAIEKNKTIVKPLFSQRAWLITAAAVALCVYFTFNLSGSNPITTEYLSGFNDFNTWLSKYALNFKVSKALVSSIVITGLMVCLQMFLLKKHFDRRFA